jgi:hypothetical protein
MTRAVEQGSQARRLYIDTSAYLCMLLGQEGWEALSKETAGSERLSSVLLVLETRRNLARLAREGDIDPNQYGTCIDRLQEDMTSFVLCDLTLNLCESVVLPAVTTPRSLDLAHLRTAQWFHAADKIDRFLTMDASQQQSAKELGLPI